MPPRQQGFGLVELMVALVLGLIVVGGASMVFIATRQANMTTSALSRLQESVRTSFDLMSREVREAGGTPCDAGVFVADVLANAQGAAPVWWATWGIPVQGFAGAAAFDGAAFGTGTAQRVANTQALVVRYGAPLDGLQVTAHDTATATFTANRAALGFTAGELMLVCNYGQAAIFQASAVDLVAGTFRHDIGGAAPGNCSRGLGLPTLCTPTGRTFRFAPGAPISRFVAAGWYIGNNGRPETGGRSLYRVTATGAQEVAEGVRDLQLGFLLPGGADYVGAGAVADWTQVVAVRVDLVYESTDTGATSGAGSDRLTRPVGFTVNLRNQLP